MSAPDGRSRFRRWPLGLFGMIALVVSVETFLARHRHEYMDFISVSWALSGQEARGEAVGSEVICLGDSELKFGLSPLVIERITGKRTYNLAVAAGRAPSTYFLLRRALEAGAKPRVVIVDFEPTFLFQPAQLQANLWAEMLEVRDMIALARSARDVRYLGQVVMARLLLSDRYWASIREKTQNSLQNRDASVKHDVAAIRRNLIQNRGALIMPHEPRESASIDHNDKNLFPTELQCHPVNWRYVRWFLELAESHQIQVFWVIPPVAPAVHENRERLGINSQTTRMIESMVKRFRHLTVVDGRRSGFVESLFSDGTIHLDEHGAIALSAGLGEVLNQSFSGERLAAWISLPPYRGLPDADRLEDLNQSAYVFKHPAVLTR